MCRGYILYNSAQCTIITKKTSVKFSLTNDTACLALTSFTTYTQNNDRDISGAQRITKKSDSIVNSPSA